MKFPRLIPKKFLGIDVGTSAIKVVELSRWAGRVRLENYGEIPASALYEKPFRTFEKSTLLFSSEDIARAIKAVVDEAKIKSQECVFSIPDFSTFFTAFELPKMTPEEISQAIEAEARKHVPLPTREVTLDWQLTSGKPLDQVDEKMEILLVAVPNEVINQYQRIALASNLKLQALEAEVFGLVRSLVGEDEKGVIGLVDIGARSTTCSIIDKRILRISYSFDVSGSDLTERISKGLSIDYKKAEDFKKEYGIVTFSQSDSGEKNIKEILSPLLGLIVRECEKIFKRFDLKEGKEVEKIILAGGSAHLPGLVEYFQSYFRKEVEIANPFPKIFYPPILEGTLKKMGPSYAIAVGMALRGLE